MRVARAAVGLLVLLAAAARPTHALRVPGGEGGVGFDDLVYSPALQRLLVPAGRTGRLDLVDPRTGAIESVSGFSERPLREPGHSQGTTSADAGAGYAYATDRGRRTVGVVDLQAKRVVAEARLAADPDYVRWVEQARQVWVTEPDRARIEVFALEPGTPPRLLPVGTIDVPGGPESLVIDPAGGRAYTNTFAGETAAVDVGSQKVVARWKNGCRGARGIAFDAARRLVLVGCAEGKVVGLDARSGEVRAAARTGRGVDSIAFSASRAHVYAPAANGGTLTIVGISGGGALTALGTVPVARGAHCAAADDAGNVYVCDPGGGRILVLPDPYPAGGPGR